MDPYLSAKEEIKRTADITELIGQYVQLKKAGQNHLGLCPFHSEKTPSFTVSSSKQMFHCFGCKKGGDIFAFWMEYHKVSFPQAMKDLAEKYRVTLPEKESTPSQKRAKELRELLFEINEAAAGYYHKILLQSSIGDRGRRYLKKRSLDDATIKDFMLGYASPDWDGLIRFLKNKGIDLNKAEQGGLIIKKKNRGFYDRFRGRVIFPIHNIRRQIVGFGGRVLDDSQPKYLNTPETPVFSKGELLYGLHEAYGHIRVNSRAVVVEGYTDVLALRQHGFKEAVATLGTALTRDHIRKLKGYTKEAIVVFDSDTAGQSATIKSLPLFLNEGLSARVMILPEGYDPDSYINEQGLNGFLELLEKAPPMFEFYLDLHLSRTDRGVEGQLELLKEILPVLSAIDNEPQRSLYVRHLSEKSGIPEPILFKELQSRGISPNRDGGEKFLREQIAGSKVRGLDDFPILNLLTHHPYTVVDLMEGGCGMLITDTVLKELFDAVYHICKGGGRLSPEEILERLENESVCERYREAMLSHCIYPDNSIGQALKEYKEKVDRVKLSRSLKTAKSSLEEKNELLMLKSAKDKTLK